RISPTGTSWREDRSRRSTTAACLVSGQACLAKEGRAHLARTVTRVHARLGKTGAHLAKTVGPDTRHTRIYRTPVPIWVMLVRNHMICDHDWLVIHGRISSSVIMSGPSSSLGLKGISTKRRRHGTYTQERPGPHRQR